MTTPQGPWGQGPAPWGQPPQGPSPYGQPPQGQGPYGQAPQGQPPQGPTPYGQSAYGQAPYGQTPPGQGPYGPPGWGAPPPPRRSTPLVVLGAVVLAVLVVAGLAIAVTRGDDVASTATGTTTTGPASTGGSPSRTTSPATTSAAAPTTTSAAGGGGALSVDLVVGDCVHVAGSSSSPDLERAPCGSPEASYQVKATADRSDDCASDSDYVYYETSRFGGDTELGALCMDVDWVPGDCFDLGREDVVRVACTTEGLDVERVGEILQGTTSDGPCPQGGYTYDERQFVVCLEGVRTA